MKTIKVTTDIFIEVRNNEQAEAAADEIDLGLAHHMGSFPEGEVIGVNVVVAKEARQEELEEHGLVE